MLLEEVPWTYTLPRCRRPEGMCPLWFCTLLTCRYVAGKGSGPACRGVFSSLLAGGSEACALPRHHGVRMARDTHMSGLSIVALTLAVSSQAKVIVCLSLDTCCVLVIYLCCPWQIVMIFISIGYILSFIV